MKKTYRIWFLTRKGALKTKKVHVLPHEHGLHARKKLRRSVRGVTSIIRMERVMENLLNESQEAEKGQAQITPAPAPKGIITEAIAESYPDSLGFTTR